MYFRLNEPRLVERALDYLQAQGSSRIALFANIGSSIPSAFDAEVKRRNLYSPEKWRFKVSLLTQELAEKIAHLLMCFPEAERPDGIFVSDDNLAAAVIKGIASTRLRIPEDISIISHYNWSMGMHEQCPAKRLGFDLKSMLFKTFEVFQVYHDSGRFSPVLEASPVFEEEL